MGQAASKKSDDLIQDERSEGIVAAFEDMC